MTNLHEGFDPEHFDEKTQVDVTSPRGTKYSDVAITYTATIVDGKPVVHPRSIVASRTDTPVAFTKQMTEIVLQDQQALAAIQQHADSLSRLHIDTNAVLASIVNVIFRIHSRGHHLTARSLYTNYLGPHIC